MSRRSVLLSSLAPLAAGAETNAETNALAELERRVGGKLGVAVLDTATGARWTHHGDERFGLCSTFKLLLAAATLAQVDAGRWRLTDRLLVRTQDLVGYAPVTRARLGKRQESRMSLVELAEAAQVHSDNGATNVLLRHLGGNEGPQALTQWLRAQGDTVTRIDRWEPEMNHVPPGEERDTSSPAAFAATVARLCTSAGAGAVLKPDSRARLLRWMVATQTGQHRLRAGLPKGWRAGDKTGTGFNPDMPDRINDVALFWPPGRAPVVVACFYEGPQRSTEWIRAEDEEVLAEVGRLAAAWVVKSGAVKATEVKAR